MAGPPQGHDPPDREQHILIRTFLIADIRGYTLFTQERGDEAAAKLTAKFAGVVKETVEARGGSLIELRGDEALAVFASARQAIRTAVELQERFVDETLADPSLPLTVGIGLDAGEAVPTEEGYRGGALNLAARLCGEAGPGECLASNQAVHLARKVEGIRYVDRGELHLKGLSEPVRVAAVRPETEDPARRLAVVAPPKPSPASIRARRRRRVGLVLLVVAALVAAVVVPIALLRDGEFPGIDENSVGLIDVETGDLRGTVSLGARPGDIAQGAGAIWVTIPDEGRIARIDPTSETVADGIPVGSGPEGIAVGEGSIWVANSASRSVSRVSPDIGAPVDTIQVGGGPLGVALGYGSLWVTNGSDDTVSRIDPVSGDEDHLFVVGDRPDTIIAGAGAIWVANSAGGSVSKIDPSTNEVAAHIPVGNGPADIHVGRGRVWVANRLDATVSMIDPDTNTERDRIPVGEGPSAVTTSQGSVWVASEFESSVSRIDPVTSSVAEAISIGNAPTALVVVRGELWVPVGPAVGTHHGGTLVVTRLAKELDSIDPAFGYLPHSWEIYSVTHDGLVGFRRTGGADGATLVPDLATSLPQPTDGGTTYTFQLRQGIRYSTGDPVRPEDFRWAIERGLADQTGDATAVNFFEGLIGGQACVEHPGTCDLSRGIVTSGDSIVFHLTQPDPEFLYKLALPPAFAVPADTPLEDVGAAPIPATGPYMISTYRPGEAIELVRNPQFEEWSAAAQPEGLVDRIEIRYGLSLERQVDEVLAGDADVALSYDPAPAGQLAELQTRFADRLHLTPQLVTIYMVLNPNVAPFDDQKVRQALNFAVDRKKVTEIYGGTEQALPTCQILPPNLPGYERYCPYTAHPGGEAEWTAPDFARARQLIRSSGTAGMKVTVWTLLEAPGGLPVGRYFESLLDRLGYRANLEIINRVVPYYGHIGDPANEVQIAWAGWVADFPAPSNFLVTNLSCGGFNNPLGYCDRQLDSLMTRASDLQFTDPPAALALWARVDRESVDQAALVPLVNPVLADFVSERLGNFQAHPIWHVLLSRLWVQ
jgi:peptide/nickel transport system substrate-binding protein